jgi:PKD repeat protein
MSHYLPKPDSRLARSITVLVVACAASVSLLLTDASGGKNRGPTSAGASHPLLGITGDLARFKRQTGQDSSVDEAFLGWGQGLSWGAPFAALFPIFAPIPMIHLGTKGENTLETITPGGIASGTGDAYLIALNDAISVWGKAIYVRPMAEMNNANNFYAGYAASGQPRDATHSPANYRKAFARIYLILHGGSRSMIDARLKALGMAPLRSAGDLLANPFPTLRVVWSPLAASNPRVPGNAAEMYYPGRNYVDVEGGDIYDEQLTDTAPWAGLESLYKNAVARGKPFSVPEWGLANIDDAAFVRHMCTFLKTHKPAETAVFYESRPGSTYDLEPKPNSLQAYRLCITPLAGAYPDWAATNAPGGGARLIVLDLQPNPASGASPLAVQFSIKAELSVPIVHWEVLFGDGAEIDGPGPPPATLPHSYTRDGLYHAALFVFRGPPFTPEAAPFFTSADVSAGTRPTPLVSFVPTPATGPVPLSVSLQTDLALPTTVSSWTMIFGDGYSRRGSGRPAHFDGHTFTTAGTYAVLLIVDTTGGARYIAVARITAGGPGGTTTTTTTPTTTPAPPATGTPKGRVLVNGKLFTGGRIPYHSTIDVSNGSLVLKTDTGQLNLYGASGLPAKFQLLRSTDRHKPIVELLLVGGDFSSCGKRKKSSALATVPSHKPIRQLWGDGKGRFQSKGRYAAATVRGTIWLTVDRCDGTLITVKRGVIEVRDVKLKTLITVKAGHSYLAKS